MKWELGGGESVLRGAASCQGLHTTAAMQCCQQLAALMANVRYHIARSLGPSAHQHVTVVQHPT
jgi:hypothetical protein